MNQGIDGVMVEGAEGGGGDYEISDEHSLLDEPQYCSASAKLKSLDSDQCVCGDPSTRFRRGSTFILISPLQ